MTSADAGAWAYRAYGPDTESEAFGPLAPIVALWQRKAPAPGIFPCWRDFDFMDFEGWWGHLSLAEMYRDPVDARWILWGTKLVEWWGREYTNQRISDQPFLGDDWKRFERPYFERLLSERLVGFVSGTLEPQGREYLYVEGVDLPLEKAGAVTHIMSAYRLRPATDTFRPRATPVFEM